MYPAKHAGLPTTTSLARLRLSPLLSRFGLATEICDDLRNLLGAKSSKELKELEPQIVFANELELESVKLPRT